MRFDDQTRIAVAGAGSIGCYAGACLALAGRRVALLARPRIVDAVTGAGLAVRDLDGTQRQLPAGRVQASADPAAVLANADIVLVTVKSGATQEMARLVARHARPGAVVVSLQNGVANPAALRAGLGARHPVVAGMVPFNVVAAMPADGAPVFHRATEGTTLVDPAPQRLAAFLDVAGFPVSAAADMDAVLWGKLLLNLNNALNALSGLPLADELADRRWRRVLAVQIAEALGAMKAAGIRPARIGRLRSGLLPAVLRLPDPLFRRLARRMLAVDPAARSSMWEDLERGRPTEIDQFQGAVIALAERHGRAAPANRAVLAAIRRAEQAGRGAPRLQPEAVLPQAGR